MQVEVLERDIQAGTARIRFSHGDVTHTQSYNLKMVVPGTDRVFETYNIEFNEAMQDTVIARLTEQVQREIEAGITHNPI